MKYPKNILSDFNLKNYYLYISNDHRNFITIFILYDLKNNLFYFGKNKIKDQSEKITHFSYKEKIPLSERNFNLFLELSLNKLQFTNKNIFLAFNGLDEWII